MKFKHRDKVRILIGEHKGKVGVISAVNAAYTAPYPYQVKLVLGDSVRHLAYGEGELEMWAAKSEDLINHPSHYRLANGVQVIDLTELLNFNRGNAVKYLSRAGRKDPATEVEDLKKARWYVDREISRIEKGNGNG